jgi:hypothetical protein
MSVGVPDIRYKYFNHYNWKGLNTNKNYFDIDPETFEDCQDVYVDENGVLKSRPSVKILEDGLKDVIDEWIFGDIRVYRTENNLYVSEPNYLVATYPLTQSIKLKLLRFDDKLLLFTPDTLLSYKEGAIQEATDLIYVPETTIYVNGIKSETSESKNILTKKEATIYLYNKVDSIYAADFYDKTVDIKINDALYENVEFKVGMENVLFDRKFKLNEKNYSPEGFLGELTTGTPLIRVQEYPDLGFTVTLLCEVDTLLNDDNEINYTVRVFYSLDGFMFEELPSISDFYNFPYLAKDFPYAIAIKKDGLHCISLVSSDKYNIYTKWTNFFTFTTSYSISKYEQYLTYKPNSYSDNCTVSGNFFDLENFSYIFFANSKLNIVSVIDNVEIDESVPYNRTFLSQPIVCDMVCDRMKYGFLVAGFYSSLNSDNTGAYSVLDYIISPESTQYDNSKYHTNDTVVNNDEIISRFNYSSQSIFVNSFYEYKELTSVFHKLRYLYAHPKNNCIYEKELSYKSYDGYVTFYSLRGAINSINLTEDSIISIGPTGILTDKYFYKQGFEDKPISLNTEIYPLSVQDNLYICNTYNSDGDKYFYSSDTSTNNIRISFTNDGAMENVDFTDLVYLNAVYGAIGNKLYISEGRYDKDGNLLLYFPEYNKHTFAENINKLHPISSSQVAIFFDDEIYYSDIQSINDNIVYTVNKSKLSVGCKKGDDVVTTFDGKYVIFPSQRGLVAMGYQDFVASTEQTLTYLSDNILDRFSSFINKPTKLYLYKYWLACYNDDGVYLLDFRNSSWWYFNYKNITRVITNNYKPLIVANGREFVLDTSSINYCDDVLKEGVLYNNVAIEWFLISQKLHLGTLNNTKQIVNITLNSLQESTDEQPMTMRLDTIDYRMSRNDKDEQTLQYGINVLRTFVKRLNHMKVNQFQYKLSYDDQNSSPIPLNVDNISIKYKITGQVR